MNQEDLDLESWGAAIWTIARNCAAALSLVLVLTSSALAQDKTTIVRATVGILPPYVMKEGSQLTGFSIDLWNEIAARLNVKTKYQEESDVDQLLASLRMKTADVVATGLFYSTERDREFDYSYPIMEAGMQVMVRDEGKGAVPTPLMDVFNLLFSRSAVVWLAVALLIVIVPAHLIWLLDRGNEDGASPGRRYVPGIFHSLTWAMTALVSQVQTLPVQWLARILGLLWMFAGVVFIALYTAELTATLTVEQIQGAINGPHDLPGKKVAAIAHSTAASYLRDIKADLLEFPAPDEMYQALLDRKVDAVLSAAPSLRYFAAHDGAGQVRMVGPEFNKNDLGFLFQLGDPLRRQVSSALVALREDGTYERIHQRWFGSE
ncbi:MAG TPA: transporter substrate-binding domain-containing protein [Dongiaceae bacterium]|jgi:polar amino acid transport system substrate-binding protein